MTDTAMNIQRDARVHARDGEVGRVKHAVVDPQTKEVTDLVVCDGNSEWLIPMSTVERVDGDRITLRADRAAVASGMSYNRDHYQDIDGEQARDESARRAVQGGAPLLDADDNQIEVGAPSGQPAPAARNTAPSRPPTAPPPNGGQSVSRLQLREEELRARKEKVQAGTATLRTEVVEEQRTLDVPLRHEEAVIERHAVTARPADGPIVADGETIRVPLMEEHAILEKETVVTGEVEIDTRTVQDTERLSGVVRREELEVEEKGDVRRAGGTNERNRPDHR